jgi:hypothetical protein
MSRALTAEERAVFDAIQNSPDIALIQTQFDGEETAVIALIIEDNSGYQVHPLAVLVTDAIMDRLTDPTPESGDK